jgi:Flp pilus assembly protein TadD
MTPLVLVLLLGQDAEALLRDGLLDLRANRTAAALAALERAAAFAPREPRVWLAMAEARLRSGDRQRAESAVEQALKLAPGESMVRQAAAMFRSRLALEASAGDRARHLAEAVRLDPARLPYRLAYAQALLDRRSEKEAEAALRLVTPAPPVAEFHRLLGLALYAQGRSEEALDEFLAAIDLAPREPAHYASIETLLPAPDSRRKAVRDRLEAYRRTAADDPLGPFLLGLDDLGRAEGLWEEAMARDAGFWPALFALHRLAVERGDLKAAQQLLERLVELQPQYAPAWYALAQIHARNGNREAARSARARHHQLTRETP